MAETHKLQEQPPEGSRKVIEHELERQSGGSEPAEDSARRSGEAPKDEGSR